jgi:hypothetical protein
VTEASRSCRSLLDAEDRRELSRRSAELARKSREARERQRTSAGNAELRRIRALRAARLSAELRRRSHLAIDDDETELCDPAPLPAPHERQSWGYDLARALPSDGSKEQTLATATRRGSCLPSVLPPPAQLCRVPSQTGSDGVLTARVTGVTARLGSSDTSRTRRGGSVDSPPSTRRSSVLGAKTGAARARQNSAESVAAV